jgi:hypothetical protein
MGGWDQLRARLVGDNEGRPMVVCFDTCLDSIRTIPALQHDAARPEDLDTDTETMREMIGATPACRDPGRL